MSPSFFIHSIARRRSLTSSGAAPSLFAFAIAFLQIVYDVFGCCFFLQKNFSDQQIRERLTANRLTVTGREFSDSVRTPGQNLRLYDIISKVNERVDGNSRFMHARRVVNRVL